MFNEIEKNLQLASRLLAKASDLLLEQKEHSERMNVDGNYCPKCNSLKSNVVDIRPNRYGVRVRRRQCKDCGKKWHTVEVLYED